MRGKYRFVHNVVVPLELGFKRTDGLLFELTGVRVPDMETSRARFLTRHRREGWFGFRYVSHLAKGTGEPAEILLGTFDPAIAGRQPLTSHGPDDDSGAVQQSLGGPEMTTPDTTVLVVYASKMGGTKGIADAIGAELTATGLAVTISDAADVRSLDGYDAVVLGSAIYASRWRPAAVRILKLLAARAGALKPIPTWLFHSGPCGANADEQVMPPKKVSTSAHRINTPSPVTFGGRLDPLTATGFIARKMAAGPLAGDFRDFTRIRAFAAGIADQLTAAKPTVVRR